VNPIHADAERFDSAAKPTGNRRRSRLGLLVRLAVLGIGFVILAESIGRYLESRRLTSVVDDIRRDRGKPIPIGDERADGEPTDGTTDAELHPEDAIDERSSADIEDEPATPGELSVDEELVDELDETDEE
jgi:hypothetical protein